MNAARSFSLAAAAAASTTAAVQAEFVDVVVSAVDPVAEGWTAEGYDASALDTYRVYAMFDDNNVDLFAVGDVAFDGIQFMMTSSDGVFVNDPLGGDFAPNALFTSAFPSLLWDTFVTIGEEVGQGSGGVAITSGAPGFMTQAGGLVGDFILDDTGYFIAGFPPPGVPIDGLVLIGQFTVNEGVSIEGTDWRLTYLDGGDIIDVFVDFMAGPIEGPVFLGLTPELVDPDAEGWTAEGYDPDALDTYRIYAEYSTNDIDITAVGDIQDNITLSITSTDGVFVNDPMGGDLPPNPNFTGLFPGLLWDTFVTIGEEVGTGGGGSPNTSVAPGFTEQAGGLAGDFTLDDTGWFTSGFPPNGEVVNGRILIAQFTVNEGVGMTGTNLRVSSVLGGIGGRLLDDFADFVVEPTTPPCPPDFDDDGSVGYTDLTRVLNAWGVCFGCIEDINGTGDDFVGFDDLVDLLNQWGACP